MTSLPPSDYLVDRRQLRRKLSFWRVAAILFLIIAVIVARTRLLGPNATARFTPHIARLSITGLITGDRPTLTLIHDIGEAKSVSAVLVSIESPGGTTTGAERIYDALRKLSAKKPTVAVVGTLAASGGYIAAIGTDEIFSRGNSIVGSIGVLVQYPNVAKLLDKIGVKVEAIKSSPLKASPDGYEETSPEARAALASLVNDSFEWFKGLVKERRKMSDQELAAVDDGRIFTGRQGIGLKLVDKIGGEQEAIAWLEQERGIRKGLSVRNWTPQKSAGGLGILGVSARLAEWGGFSELSRTLDYGQSLSDARLLDGLVSIWQFDSTQGN
jgi:protease IV